MYLLSFDAPIPLIDENGNIPIWMHFIFGTSPDSIFELMTFGAFASNGSMFYAEVDDGCVGDKRRWPLCRHKTPYINFTQERKFINMECRADLEHICEAFITWLHKVRQLLTDDDTAQFQIHVDQILEWVRFREWFDRQSNDGDVLFSPNIVDVLYQIHQVTGDRNISVYTYLQKNASVDNQIRDDSHIASLSAVTLAKRLYFASVKLLGKKLI